MNKKLKKLCETLNETLCYNQKNKDEFKKASMSFLKSLSKELNLSPQKVYFNPGGIAVSGDAHLMGMFNDNIGIYIDISESMGTPNFLYRTITNMNDYRGGSNRYINLESIEDSKEIVDIIKSCKR